jgi:hypothetical protein
MAISQTDINVLADAILNRMKQEHHVFWVDPEAHAEQHGFLALLIKEREEKLARRRRIEEKIAGSVLLSMIVLVIGLIGAGALGWLRDKLNRG